MMKQDMQEQHARIREMRQREEACREDMVNRPNHYAAAYPFEVDVAICLLLDTFCADMKPSDCGRLYAELKYRLRAGLKEDGHNGAQDIAKAMQFRKMREK